MESFHASSYFVKFQNLTTLNETMKLKNKKMNKGGADKCRINQVQH